MKVCHCNNDTLLINHTIKYNEAVAPNTQKTLYKITWYIMAMLYIFELYLPNNLCTSCSLTAFLGYDSVLMI